MITLLILTAALLAAQQVCSRLARRTEAQMMSRPADDWDGDDIDRWLELIEPFPLAVDRPRQRKS